MTSEGKSHQSYAESDDIALNDCWIAGMEHFNKNPKPVTEFKLSCFVSKFGTSPCVCLELWNLTETARKGMRRSTRHIHLLMALFLLKNYGRSRASASAFGVYTSTWQYYTERFVHAISALSTTKVRGLVFIVSHGNCLRDNSPLSHVICLFVNIYPRFAGWIGSSTHQQIMNIWRL